jgi:hypothetical protein
MKTKFLLTVIILVTIACTSKNQSLLSQGEKEKVVKEIDLVINSIFDGWRNLDVNKAFKESFSDSPDFNYIGVDGSIMTYIDFFNTAKKEFDSQKKSEFNINEKKILVISNDVAVVSLNYSGAFYSIDSKLTFPNCGGTFIFKKIEEKWKVIHFQESIQESKFVVTKIN